VAAVTADATAEIPPDWVPWHALLYWVPWIVRRYYRPEFDEATAKRWMPDVVQALRHDVDDRIKPRLGLWEVQASGEDALAGGRFVEEIDWLDNYVVESWSTGSVQRRVPQEGDPPGFTLAAHWDWLMTAVQQVARQAGLALRGSASPVGRAGDDLAPSQSQLEVEADEAELRRAKAEAETLRQELLLAQMARAEAEADAAELRHQAAEAREGSAEPPQELPPRPDPKAVTKAKPKKKLAGRGGGQPSEVQAEFKSRLRQALRAPLSFKTRDEVLDHAMKVILPKSLEAVQRKLGREVKKPHRKTVRVWVNAVCDTYGPVE
jgi:hypothetical protein